MFEGLRPLLSRLPDPSPYLNDRKGTLEALQSFESKLQKSRPTLLYKELLSIAYTNFAESLDLPKPSQEEAKEFGSRIGAWPAFPDTVAALKSLKKHYKLVILSNIDNESIAATIAGPLGGVDFDLVLTAQDIGSYKPDLNNFNCLLEKVKSELGVEKHEILHTAQALVVDHGPAKKLGIRSAWINREDQQDLLEKLRDEVDFTWEYETMGEMAKDVESAFKG